MTQKLRSVSGPVVREGQPPPMDLDAEAAVLSAVMLDDGALDRVGDIVDSPQMFFSEAHQQIFGAMLDIRDAGRPIDMINLATRLRDLHVLDAVGGIAYLTEILDAAPSIANARTYAVTVREKFRLRQLAYTCERIRAEAYCGTYDNAQAFLSDAEARIAEIAAMPETSTVEGAKPIVTRVFEKIQKMATTGITPTTKSGFEAIDAITSGFGPGELTVIAARPGMGKSALVLNMLQNITDSPDSEGNAQGAILFSMEMPKEQIARRALCSSGKVPISNVKRAILSQSEWNRLTDASVKLASLPLMFDDQPAQTVHQLQAKIRQVRAQMAQRKKPAKLRVVAVDYLQLLRATSAASKNNRQEVVAEIARGLKGIALGESVAVIALSQLNRDVEKRNDKRATMSDLRESGEIENAADNIAFLYREDYYAKQKWREVESFKPTGECECQFVKLRDGDAGMVKLHFDDIYTLFSDYQGA